MDNHRKKQKKLLPTLRDDIRLKGYSYNTEKNYVKWVRDFIFFHNKTHPDKLDESDVSDFLTFLVNKRNVSPSTQNQALCAILFLYRQVLGRKDFYVREIQWSKKSTRIPVVLSVAEVKRLLDAVSGKAALPLKLMYGTGLRVSECIRLRVQDLDHDLHACSQDRWTCREKSAGCIFGFILRFNKCTHSPIKIPRLAGHCPTCLIRKNMRIRQYADFTICDQGNKLAMYDHIE